MTSKNQDDDWIRFNLQTHTYDTRDGTRVAAELVENVQCLADVLYIASIRAKQRAQIAATAQADKGGDTK